MKFFCKYAGEMISKYQILVNSNWILMENVSYNNMFNVETYQNSERYYDENSKFYFQIFFTGSKLLAYKQIVVKQELCINESFLCRNL